MAKSRENASNQKTVELATFYVGDALCGMDILKVQEINKLLEMTKVPQAPGYVKGIVNLRGQIVTVVDLGKKLGLSKTNFGSETRNIIVNSDNEYIGLLVDSIGDVERTDWDKIEPPPANIGGVQGKFFEGVFKKERSLIGILNVEEVLKEEE
jgi:purine-binding chemotaxis protein CheW